MKTLLESRLDYYFRKLALIRVFNCWLSDTPYALLVFFCLLIVDQHLSIFVITTGVRDKGAAVSYEYIAFDDKHRLY